MIKAKWREGVGLFKADAQKVAEEIISIGEEATPKDVVEKAEDEKTELHKCFTWDDDRAAKNWRLYEARQVMCQLVIQEDEVPADRPEVRVFYKCDGKGGYKHTEHIVKHEDEYQALLARAYAELKAFKARYACLEELQDIFEMIK